MEGEAGWMGGKEIGEIVYQEATKTETDKQRMGFSIAIREPGM